MDYNNEEQQLQVSVANSLNAIIHTLQAYSELGSVIESKHTGTDSELTETQYNARTLYRMSLKNKNLFDAPKNVIKIYRLIGILPPTQMKKSEEKDK